MSQYKKEYFSLLEKLYPSRIELATELINLETILSLPKGTEHFMSDIHGEAKAFRHILNNCSGVIKEKVDMLFPKMSTKRKKELCTLIYYPNEKLEFLKSKGVINDKWYEETLHSMISLTANIGSKYTRSKVKKAMPKQFSYIIDELIHTKDNRETNIKEYHQNIIETIISIGEANDFIIELAELIKRLAVDHLHIAGDIFDRGEHPEKILDMLEKYHSLDIEFGNHDILWMGAAFGIEASILYVLYNNIKYKNCHILENVYGISLRPLEHYVDSLYKNKDSIIDKTLKTILILIMKLEGNIIMRNPEYKMDERLLLNKINYNKGTITLDGIEYLLKDKDLPNIDKNDPYKISTAEEKLINTLVKDFRKSVRLQKHMKFLLENGSSYKAFNNNLIYHGCIPTTNDGLFKEIEVDGKVYKGKAYLDKIDEIILKVAHSKANQKEKDYMYYLWAGIDSPFTGRIYKTFEMLFIDDKNIHKEPRNPYYEFRNNEEFCNKILEEFNLPLSGHIINGHLPIKVKNGEDPIKANGKLIIIDGGFCKAYHEKVGNAGYTLIYNSYGLRIKAHGEFTSFTDVIEKDNDIISDSRIIETFPKRMTVRDTNKGKTIEAEANLLREMLSSYRLK